MTILAALAAVALLGAPVRPDPALTPGVVNPAVTQANIGDTICAAGWSAAIRPPPSYTSALKRRQLKAMGLAGKRVRFEEDHLISLELGGHPRDPRNLWPEPLAGRCGARAKDRLENWERRAVCAGRITLAQAQADLAGDWIAAYGDHIGPLPCSP